MLIASKPPLNLLAGWQYLFSKDYRQAVNEDWQSEPAWIVAMQVVSGACSVLFPLIVLGLLALVAIGRLT